MHLENVVKTIRLLWGFFKVLFPPKLFDEIEIKLKKALVLLNITWGCFFLLLVLIIYLPHENKFTQFYLTYWQES